MGISEKGRHVENHALTEADFFSPNFSPLAYGILKKFGKSYLRSIEGIASINARGFEYLYEGIKAHQAGEGRLIVLFRHAAKEDAPVLMHTIFRLTR